MPHAAPTGTKKVKPNKHKACRDFGNAELRWKHPPLPKAGICSALLFLRSRLYRNTLPCPISDFVRVSSVYRRLTLILNTGKAIPHLRGLFKSDPMMVVINLDPIIFMLGKNEGLIIILPQKLENCDIPFLAQHPQTGFLNLAVQMSYDPVAIKTNAYITPDNRRQLIYFLGAQAPERPGCRH